MNELTLFEAYRARPADPQALEAILRHYQDSVYNLCYQVLRHVHDAEDAAQKVLVQAVKALPKIADARHFRHWLHQASLHVALNLKREMKNRVAHERRPAPPDVRSFPVEMTDALHEGILDLDGDLRTIIVEYYYERRSLEEMGVERGCSAVAVWKKVRKAKDEIRKSLAQAGLGAFAPLVEAHLSGLVPVRAPASLARAVVARSQGTSPVPAAKGTLASVAPRAAGATVVGVVASVVTLLAAFGGRGLAGRWASGLRARPEGPTPTSTAGPSVSRSVAVAQGPSPVPDAEVIPLLTIDEAYEAVRKATAIVDDAKRSAALRRLGIRLSPEVLSRVWPRHCKKGTLDFSLNAQAALFEQWKEADPAGLVRWIRSLAGNPARKAEALEGVLIRVAESHPDLALELGSSLSEEEGRGETTKTLSMIAFPARYAAEVSSLPVEARSDRIYLLAASWARATPLEAIAWAGTLREEVDRDYALKIVASTWAKRDPRSALSWAGDRADLVQCAAEACPQDEPRLAAEALVRILGSLRETDFTFHQSADALHRILCSWVGRSFQEALDYLESAPVPAGLRERLLSDVVGARARQDPEEALALAGKLPEGRLREESQRSAVLAWAATPASDLPGALALAQKLPEKMRGEAVWQVVAGWAESDPPAAAAAAAQLPEEILAHSNGTHASLLAAIGCEWARKDPDPAISWAQGLSVSARREEALLGAAQGLIQDSDPKGERALGLLGEIADPKRHDQACRDLTLSLAPREPVEAAAATRLIADPALRDEALRVVVPALGARDFKQAMDLASEVSRPEVRHDALLDVLMRIPPGDLSRAADHVRSHPQGFGLLHYAGLASRWADVDSAATAAWVLSLPETADLVDETRTRSRTVELRRDILRRVIWAWGLREAEAPEAWVRQAALPPSEADALLERISKGRSPRRRAD